LTGFFNTHIRRCVVAQLKEKNFSVTIPNPKRTWHPEGMLNKEFAETNQEFRSACKAAGIPPTTRQASKWRMKKGLAYTSKYKTKSE
jgi:hypothetical protein